MQAFSHPPPAQTLKLPEGGFLYILVARGGIESSWGHPIRLSKLLWPSSSGVEYPEYLDGAILNSVRNDVRVVGDDHFLRACDSSSAS